MEIIQRITRMTALSTKLSASDVQIGLVTTMGVIHAGHLSLIEAARKMTDLVVVSIFVNPLQFASEEEYRAYPRDFTKDNDLLSQKNIDYVFAPPEEEMFPADFSTYVQVEKFGENLAGVHLPVIFRGMTTANLKLINIIRPAFLFLGLKDALQGAILRKMVKDLNLGTEVVMVPVARYPSGLAHGTRNYFLSDAEKMAAPVLYRSLKAAEEAIAGGERQAKKLAGEISRVVESEPLARLEYVFKADPTSMERVRKIQDSVLIGVGARIGANLLSDSLLIQVNDQ
jgi:pantoate--beta-alanine ligase